MVMPVSRGVLAAEPERRLGRREKVKRGSI
jgi:hypothetical protein